MGSLHGAVVGSTTTFCPSVPSSWLLRITKRSPPSKATDEACRSIEYLVLVTSSVVAVFTHLPPRLPDCLGQFTDSSTGLVSKC